LIEGKINGDSEEKEFDPRSILANLPPLPALEAFNKHRDFLTNPQSLLAGLAAGQGRVPFTAASLMGMTGFQPPHTTFSPLSLPTPPSMAPSGTPARPPSQPTTPSSQQSSSPIQQNFSSQQNWSFEEQFKQVGIFLNYIKHFIRLDKMKTSALYGIKTAMYKWFCPV
jgi:hypothetical protein